MKKMITLTVLCTLFGAVALMAQIPNTSPIPVGFSVDAADGWSAGYEYSSMADFGDTLVQTVTAPLEWAYGPDSLDVPDSLCCTPVTTDMTGKIALIRRGVCNFSLKIWHAQEAGAVGVIIVNNLPNADDGGLVNMAGGDSAALVVIPAIFITYDDCEIILERLDNGVDVDATFEVRSFSNPRTAYAYKTPLAAVQTLTDMGATYINIDGTDTIPSVTIEAVITEPGGGTTTLSKELTDVPPLSVNPMTFDDAYNPSEVGTYHVRFTNSLSMDELEQEFVVGDDNTFAIDNGQIVPNTNGTIEPGDDTFVDSYNFTYDMGNVYRTGDAPLMATHASFMISNPDELYSGDPESDVFKINLYPADPDGNDSIPYPADLASYNGLNENGGPLFPLAQTEYVIQETDQGFDLLTVEFDDPVMLTENNLYLIMVQYNGVGAGTGIPPKYAFAGEDRMAGEVGTMIFTDMLHTDGWGNNYNGVIRLHLDGFTNSDEVLDHSKMTISPNPASSYVNLNLELEEVAEMVTVRIFNINGSVVETQEFENVQNGTFNFNIDNLSNGTYFMNVYTPEGFRSKQFQVAR